MLARLPSLPLGSSACVRLVDAMGVAMPPQAPRWPRPALASPRPVIVVMNPANPLDALVDTMEHSARRWGGAPEPSARSVVVGAVSIGEWALPLQPQPGGTHALLI